MFAIGRALRTLSTDTLAGSVLAVTVFCFVLGSSSSLRVSNDGHKLRWLALFALFLVGVGLAVRERRGPIERPLLLVGGAGAWLASLGLVSTAWAAQPHLTLGRAGSFALLLLTAGLLAFAARNRPGLPRALLFGVLAATVAAALVGVAMLAFDHGDAVQAAWSEAPARFRGLGMNPDTLAMLDGLAAPIAFWWLIAAERTAARLLALGSVVLLIVVVGASGSRGGMIAMTVGGLVVALALGRTARQRLVLVLAVCLASGIAVGGSTIPKPLPFDVVQPSSQLPASLQTPPEVGTTLGSPEQQYAGRLSDELYRVYSGKRSLFSSDGREQALWLGIHEGNARPVLGYGFGLEEKVFVDRVYNFQGTFVENSFVGLYLQLGVVGVLSLFAMLGVIVWVALLGARRADLRAGGGALAGAVAGGIALMFVQSYAYSVGNVTTAAFWTVAFASAAVAVAPAHRPVAVATRGEGLVAAS